MRIKWYTFSYFMSIIRTIIIFITKNIVFTDKATLILTVEAFKEPHMYDNLPNISRQDVTKIEKYLEGDSAEDMGLKVRNERTKQRCRQNISVLTMFSHG